MTMGPEIFAWTGGLIDISGSWMCFRRSGSGGAPLRGHFDLDLHFGLVESRDDEQRRRRADVAENLAADRKMSVGVPGVGKVIGRTHDIGHREAAILQRLLDGLEAVSCLARDIRRHRHGGVIVAGGAGNEGKIAVDDGAAVAGGLFERRAGGDELAWHSGLDLGVCAVYGLSPAARNPSLYHRERCVTSEAAGAAEPHRRTKMSLTIMTAISITTMAVMALRRRGRASSPGAGRLSGMMSSLCRVPN